MDSLRIYAVQLGSATVLFSAVLLLTVLVAPLLTSQVFWQLRRRPGFQHLGQKLKLGRVAFGLSLCFPLGTYLATRSLVFGLLSLIFVPLSMVAWYQACERNWRAELEESAVTYLATLQGLVGVGYGLPNAMMELSRSLPGPFTEVLSEYLDGFDKGRSLQTTLERFRKGTGLKTLGLYLALLEMCYRTGLSVGPMLHRILPILTAEQMLQVRVRSARRNAWAQGFMAFCLPWFVLGTLAFFQPAVLISFWNWSSSGPLIVLALGIECLGVWALWQVSRFY